MMAIDMVAELVPHDKQQFGVIEGFQQAG